MTIGHYFELLNGIEEMLDWRATMSGAWGLQAFNEFIRERKERRDSETVEMDLMFRVVKEIE